MVCGKLDAMLLVWARPLALRNLDEHNSANVESME
jgi:hypothetical protein